MNPNSSQWEQSDQGLYCLHKSTREQMTKVVTEWKVLAYLNLMKEIAFLH